MSCTIPVVSKVGAFFFFFSSTDISLSAEMFQLTGISTEIKSYVSTFRRVESSLPVPRHLGELVTSSFKDKIDTTLSAIIENGTKLPEFCHAPSTKQDQHDMHKWIITMLNDHCMVMMGTQAVPCKKYHSIDPLTPCPVWRMLLEILQKNMHGSEVGAMLKKASLISQVFLTAKAKQTS